MMVKDLIVKLLNHDLNKQITIQYPTEQLTVDNYSAYNESKEFIIVAGSTGVIIGVENVNK